MQAGEKKDFRAISVSRFDVLKHIPYYIIGVLCAIFVQSCSLIDDDLAYCGYDYTMVYHMKLITNMQMELDAVLYAEEDVEAKEAVERYLSPIFSDHAHDVDLSFYLMPDDVRKYYRHEIINDNRKEFEFYLPVEDYQHVAVANIEQNGVAYITDTTGSATFRLAIVDGERVKTQHTGIFTARLPMQVKDTVEDQQFSVTLYMANSAVILLIDTTGQTVTNLRAEVRGTADEMLVSDSVYSFSRHVIVDAEQVDIKAADLMPAAGRRMPAKADERQICFVSVNFPSEDTADADGNYWTVAVYATLPDGTVTETLLSVKTALLAGQAKVIKAQLQDNGALVPVSAPEVGATVILDWKSGGEHEIII